MECSGNNFFVVFVVLVEKPIGETKPSLFEKNPDFCREFFLWLKYL
jgi:hypothetical protein